MSDIPIPDDPPPDDLDEKAKRRLDEEWSKRQKDKK